MADIILLKGVSHTAMPLLAPREPAVAFDPMTGDAKLWIGTTVGNELVSGSVAGATGFGVSALDSGVKADNGITDNAPFLAAARAASVAAHTARILLPPGVIGMSSPWAFTSPDYVPPTGPAQTGQDAGPIIVGAGITANADPAKLGSALVMRAAGQPSLIDIGRGSMVMGDIGNLSLFGYGTNLTDTSAGLLISQTNFSQLTLHDLLISGVDTVVKVRYGSANANGEQLRLERIYAHTCNCFYDSQAGQAYGDVILGGECTVNDHGEVLRLGGGATPQTGFQFRMDSTGLSFPTAQADNTLLHVYSYVESVQVVNVRSEKTGRLLVLPGGSPTLTGQIGFSQCYLPGMPTGAVIVSGGGTNSQHTVAFSDCTFLGPGGASTLRLAAMGGGSLDRVTYTRCHFRDWGSIDPGTHPPGGTASGARAGVVLNDCDWINPNDGAGGYLLRPLTN